MWYAEWLQQTASAAQPSPSAFPKVPCHLLWGLTRCTSASHSQLSVRGGRVRGFLRVSVFFLGEVRSL